MTLRSYASTQPFWCFVVLAYVWSWAWWGLAAILPGGVGQVVAHYAGGFGPMLAAISVVHIRGDSVRNWFIGLFRWRVGPLWLVFVLGFPILFVALISIAYVMLGHTLDLSLLPSRLPAYGPTLVFLALIGGGNEEPGWRGFGLAELQRNLGPMRSTVILGAIWALWHLPLLVGDADVMSGAMPLSGISTTIVVTFISISAHAFWYTWIMNRTGSVQLCILLHGSYNAANGLLLLVPEGQLAIDYPVLLALMTASLVGSVLALILCTRGRLGLQPPEAEQGLRGNKAEAT